MCPSDKEDILYGLSACAYERRFSSDEFWTFFILLSNSLKEVNSEYPKTLEYFSGLALYTSLRVSCW